MVDVPTLAWSEQWPFLPVLERFGVALSIGLFIGIEREYSQKLGARTFGLAAILGCLAGMAGVQFIWMATAIILLVLSLINWRRLSAHNQLATTTTLSLSIVFFLRNTLWTWPSIHSRFGRYSLQCASRMEAAYSLIQLRPITTRDSLRNSPGGSLLHCDAGIACPSCRSRASGRSRSNWASVVIIAGIAFINYILLKSIGPRGMELTAFFGGLINSRKVIVEFILRAENNSEALLPIIFRGAMLATSAMALRNAVIIAVLSGSNAMLTFSICGRMSFSSFIVWLRA